MKVGDNLRKYCPEGKKDKLELWIVSKQKKDLTDITAKTKEVIDLKNTGEDIPDEFWNFLDEVEMPDQKKTEPEEPKKKEVAEKRGDIIDMIRKISGNDVLEIFGETGTGKSKIVTEIALQAKADGKTLYFYDTERNITEDIIKQLDKNYRYNPKLEELKQFAIKPPKVDIIIVDSIGFPVLTRFAMMNMKQRGEAMLDMIAILGCLKLWCYENNSIAIVVNQPKSELSVAGTTKTSDEREPFGDKSAFAAKTILHTKFKERKKDKTVISLTSFRSRDMGFGDEVANIIISNKGVDINWLK